MKHTHAPEAGAAGLGVYIAVLMKFFALHIVAQGETAIETERIVIPDHLSPE